MTGDRRDDVAVVRLAEETIEQLAARVVDLLNARGCVPPASDPSPSGSGLLSASDVSRWWGVERGWVYQHADQLGAIRLGTGRRPRLRFDPERVRRAMGDPLTDVGPRSPRAARARRKPLVGGSCRTAADSRELLPIYGEQSYGR